MLKSENIQKAVLMVDNPIGHGETPNAHLVLFNLDQRLELARLAIKDNYVLKSLKIKFTDEQLEALVPECFGIIPCGFSKRVPKDHIMLFVGNRTFMRNTNEEELEKDSD